MMRLVWQEFTTDLNPESERFSASPDELTGHAGVLADATQKEAPFSGTVRRCHLDVVEVARISATLAGQVSMAELMGDDRNAVFVVLCLEGGILCRYGGSTLELEPGEGVICDSAEFGGLDVESGTQYWVLKVARAEMMRTIPLVKRFAELKLSHTGMAVRLLTRYLDGLQGGGDSLGSGREARMFGEHLVDLIGMAVRAEGDVAQLAERRGVRAVRHAAVLREIERHISDKRLSAAAVAARLGVTPRYIHFLLEESGLTFSEHVLARRLKTVATLLGDRDSGKLKISAIARQAGFADMSYFNRSFRSRFGETPSGYRKKLWSQGFQ